MHALQGRHCFITILVLFILWMHFSNGIRNDNLTKCVIFDSVQPINHTRCTVRWLGTRTITLKFQFISMHVMTRITLPPHTNVQINFQNREKCHCYNLRLGLVQAYLKVKFLVTATRSPFKKKKMIDIRRHMRSRLTAFSQIFCDWIIISSIPIINQSD